MKLVRLGNLEPQPAQDVFARLLLEGVHSNVRLIRLAPGQALPPHRHGVSDLMLYAVAGQGELQGPTGVKPFAAGALAFYTGDEELRVRNVSATELTLLAFLSPKFATG